MHIMDSGSGLALVPSVASSALYAAVMAIHFVALSRRSRAQSFGTNEPVSILKPLAGADDELAENLESFAAIDHPAFEILFGVASLDDAATPIARAFIARHPEVRARLVVTDPRAAVNPKVAQLLDLERAATGTIAVISDSNVRVRPSYLRSLVQELARPNVGLVTNVFAGTGERTVGAALENLQLATMTAPAVVASSVLPFVRPLTVGKSMAMRRADLEAIGGFERVADVLAEDYVLGDLFLDAGFEVRTCLDVIENPNVDCSARRTLERHTRWVKMRRALAPRAFLLEPLMCPFVIASICVAASPSRATAIALGTATLLQIVLAFLAVRILRGRAMSWYWAPLEIVRSAAALFCWVRALASRRIEWRGHPFMILPGSIIVPAQRRWRWRAARA
jgi:ceramide glucosyltransferase